MCGFLWYAFLEWPLDECFECYCLMSRIGYGLKREPCDCFPDDWFCTSRLIIPVPVSDRDPDCTIHRVFRSRTARIIRCFQVTLEIGSSWIPVWVMGFRITFTSCRTGVRASPETDAADSSETSVEAMKIQKHVRKNCRIQWKIKNTRFILSILL